MDWIILVATTLVSVIITSTFGVYISRKMARTLDKKEREETLQEERNRELAILKNAQEEEKLKETIVAVFKQELEPIKRDLRLLKKGNQASLRHDLNTIADMWLPKGYCPRNVKADFDNIYRLYHAMGENGVMDDIYKKIMELPESKPRASSSTTTTKRGRKPSALAVVDATTK